MLKRTVDTAVLNLFSALFQLAVFAFGVLERGKPRV